MKLDSSRIDLPAEFGPKRKTHQETSQPVKYQEFGEKLSLKTKFFYSFGHVYNDLCAAIWFSYTLLYFQLSFNSATAGLLLLLGQVADAISTPLIGYGSDKSITFLNRYGRRKIWHLIGSVFVTCSFPFIFNPCILCSKMAQWETFLYYSLFICLFQFGWAAVQVSHLSLITDLTDVPAERLELNSYRQAANVASSICVYSITLMFLGVEDSTITKNDSIVFMKLVHLITFIGIGFSVLFHVFVKEPRTTENYSIQHYQNSRADDQKNSNDLERSEEENFLKETLSGETIQPKGKKDRSQRVWRDWLGSISFWKICLIYMMSRLYVNVTQCYTPLYLQETLRLAKRNIAIVPFITYFAGFLFSMVGKSKIMSSKSIMTLGCFFGSLSCLWIWIGYLKITIWEIFSMAACFGIGGTLTQIGSLSLTADLIHTNKISGAFVYGLMSFFDKLVNGIVIASIQYLKPEQLSKSTTSSSVILTGNFSTEAYHNLTTTTIGRILPETIISDYRSVFYLYVLVFVSGAAVILTFLSLISIMKSDIQSFFTKKRSNR